MLQAKTAFVSLGKNSRDAAGKKPPLYRSVKILAMLQAKTAFEFNCIQFKNMNGAPSRLPHFDKAKMGEGKMI